jgi:glycosyltransferase involved in cell wall biosynthesis
MIVGNFYHIKSTNGLFFYGLDYLRENLSLVRKVLVRPVLEGRIRSALPGIEIVACSASRFLREATLSSWRGDLLFTPTSHPLPGINRQWIVLHDAYPFEVGSMSTLKRLLLRWSLSLSRCQVGYINRSDAKPFVAKLGVPNERMVFAPNRFPEPLRRISQVSSSVETMTVGLLGTDSAKKNYDQLFSAVRRADLSSRLAFRVYGHETTYFRDIYGQFPDLRIELAKSDDESLDEFMSRVDVLVSAAEQEGFGRPIASALLAGLPVELLDRPVFREFFSGGARFHANIDMLVQSLLSRSDEFTHTSYAPPTNVVAAYAAANDEIRRLGSITLS